MLLREVKMKSEQSIKSYALSGLPPQISLQQIPTMIKIEIEFNNCSLTNSHIIKEECFSSLKVHICTNKIPSVQSKKEAINDIRKEIHKKLSVIEWMMGDDINIDIAFYLSGYERITTDKSADIDNMLKPLIDSFTGKNGIFIDDSQISSLNMLWLSKNEEFDYDLIVIEFHYNNDYAYPKKNLYFVQCHKALFFGIIIDKADIQSLFITKLISSSRRKSIKLSERVNPNYGTGLLPIMNVHKSRLNGFDLSSIITTKQLNKLCKDNGLTYIKFRKMFLDMRTQDK